MNKDRVSSIRRHPPVLVIGLDGATFDRIIPWAKDGTLPTFARLMDKGTWAPLRSSIPPMTSQAWSSFATGTNPGKHGLFAFEARQKGTYRWSPTSSAQRRCITMWEYAGRHERRAGVFNMPMTYPPDSIPGGFMVSGMGVPDINVDFTWPTSLKQELLQNFTADQLIERRSFDSPSSHIRYLLQTIDDNLAVIRFLLNRHPDTDLFCGAFIVSDRVQHHYWQQMQDPSAPEEQRNAIRTVYQRLDAALDTLVTEHPDHVILIVSDHGFGPFSRTVNVNSLLASNGWLIWAERSASSERVAHTWRGSYRKLRSLLPAGMTRKFKTHLPARMVTQLRRNIAQMVLPVDWRRTQAYSAYDVGAGDAIYLNLKGRQPLGCVEPGDDSASLLSQIERQLTDLRDPKTGEKVADAVYRKSDLYHGDASDEAPDLVVYWKDGYCGGIPTTKLRSEVFQESSPQDYSKLALSGTHRLYGIFIAAGPGIRSEKPQREISIIDVAPTILHLVGLPIPDNMDGRVIEEVLDPAIVNWPVSITRSEQPDRHESASVYDDAEQGMIEERLRDLGYLG